MAQTVDEERRQQILTAEEAIRDMAGETAELRDASAAYRKAQEVVQASADELDHAKSLLVDSVESLEKRQEDVGQRSAEVALVAEGVKQRVNELIAATNELKSLAATVHDESKQARTTEAEHYRRLSRLMTVVMIVGVVLVLVALSGPIMVLVRSR